MLARQLQQAEEALAGCLSPSRTGYVFDSVASSAAGIMGRLLPDVKVTMPCACILRARNG